MASDPVYLIINFLYLVYVLFWQVSSYFTGDHKESLCWTRIILRTVDRKMKLLQRETADKNHFQGYGTNISIKNIFELFIITNENNAEVKITRRFINTCKWTFYYKTDMQSYISLNSNLVFSFMNKANSFMLMNNDA